MVRLTHTRARPVEGPPRDLVLSLDAEDFVTPEAADAQLWWAEELSRRSVRGSFQVVGELLRSLDRRGRSEVVAALGRHETGYHTDRHSLPPRHAEAVAGLTLAEGLARVRRLEAPGLRAFRRAFGRDPVAFCAPGGAWTAATLVAMAAAGVRVLTNGNGLTGRSRRPVWFCGLLVADVALRLDDYMGPGEVPAALAMRHLEALRRESAEDGVLVVSTHPDRLVTARFWDQPLHGGQRVSSRRLGPAPLWPASRVQALKDRVRRWLDELQSQAGLRLTDFAAVHAARAAGRRDLDVLLGECGLGPRDAGRLPLRAESAVELCFSPAPFRWAVLPPAFDARRLIAMARGLAWTAAPAPRAQA